MTWRFAANEAGFELTDRLTTVVSTLPAGRLHVLIRPFGRTPSVEEVVPDSDGNYTVTFWNLDAGCTGGAVKADDYTLDEYQLLYRLTNMESQSFPVPQGHYLGDMDDKAILSADPSDCLPICGGANCPGRPRP